MNNPTQNPVQAGHLNSLPKKLGFILNIKSLNFLNIKNWVIMKVSPIVDNRNMMNSNILIFLLIYIQLSL